MLEMFHEIGLVFLNKIIVVNWVALTKDKQVLKMWIIESGNCDAIIFNEKLGLICKPSSSLARQTSETHTRGTITNFAWCNIVLGACLHPHLPTTPMCFPTHSKAFHLKYITFIIYLCSNMLIFPPYMGWIGVCLVRCYRNSTSILYSSVT